ncbi:major capsid protein [Mycolicibacterium mucogenicum]|uniref:Major capsid protein n=1 Tax=Mycolicibacterium mucogenicum DSM 44124 TaxID=1226753 RepID=A0A8H2J8Y6_MYCMU|nr:major capsid protein [Mycolicibacterium mucogenicum]KAB7761185.1 hypothetical protein MMUC44124_00890 [Mycolicibacterium mucogenicum DSM 44124]QPG69990.1 major capsid protein [Mycolicibacterium mucogenicum DSM 44124]
MKFSLPEQLPATTVELDVLIEQATAQINLVRARHSAGEELSNDDVTYLKGLLADVKTLNTARDEALASETAHAADLDEVLAQAAAATTATSEAAPEAAAEETDEGAEGAAAAADVVAEAEQVAAEAAEQSQTVTAGARPVTFAGAAPGAAPDVDASRRGEKPKGWHLVPSAPKYAEFGNSEVGFADIARSISSVDPASGQGLQQTGTAAGGFAKQAIAALPRKQEVKLATSESDVQEFLDSLGTEVPGHGKATAKTLVAAGGWCAPSQQIYTFCAVPPASGLISLPDFPFDMSRGGVRVPVNPDISSLLTGLWQYTEAELEATNAQGDPTAVKPIMELPCPDQFIEWRLEALGWAAKAGILQRQAWPEAIENALAQIQVAHQHRVSQKTIGKMVAGSGAAKVLPAAQFLGATTGVLNGLALQAVNLRIDKGLADDAVIEGVAPVWFREVLRADLAMREDKDTLAVTNAEIDSWLAVRNIYLQYVVDWQTKGAGQPGNLATLNWPNTVDVMLYPAGTWFRQLANVITLGVQYPLQQLQLNQYTHIFTEDSFQVGKRCNQSILVRIPLCINGAIGARGSITCP